jgi:choline kinase
LGPSLYGVFEGGRVEELLRGHTLEMKNLQDSSIEENVARAYARFHSMKLPLPNKLASDLANRVKKLSPETLDAIKKLGYDITLFTLEWNRIVPWLRDELEKIGSRLVFTHCDTNFLNIFVREDAKEGETNIAILDYEMSKYSYRAFDLGSHFVNRMCRWGATGDKRSKFPYPSIDERRRFIKLYLEETKRIGYLNDFDENGRDSVDTLLQESRLGSLFYMVPNNFTLLAEEILSKHHDFFSVCSLLLQTYQELVNEHNQETSGDFQSF